MDQCPSCQSEPLVFSLFKMSPVGWALFMLLLLFFCIPDYCMYLVKKVCTLGYNTSIFKLTDLFVNHHFNVL